MVSTNSGSPAFDVINARACDIDGDCMADFQDTDSDNDGCPDALEGAGSFDYPDLSGQTLSGGVDANGVPIAAAGGQPIGSSQDAASQVVECDECTNLNHPDAGGDNDADAITDVCDLDDDNDGILDLVECPFVNTTFENTSIIGSSPGAGADMVPLATTLGVPFNWGGFTATVTGTGVNTRVGFPGGPGSTATINFAPSLLYIDFAITDLDGGEIVDVRIYDKNGALVPYSTSYLIETTANQTLTFPVGQTIRVDDDNGVAGSDWDNLVRFIIDDVLISRIEVDLVSTNSGSPAFDVINARACDTDGDCVPDYQDTDSDNDGCPDAIEGAGSFVPTDLDANDMLTGGVDANGVPTVAAGGQGTTGAVTDSTDISACCPDFSTITVPMVTVVESICDTPEPRGGVPEGGSLSAPTTSCPTGSSLQYSTDGTTWSSTLPTYDQINSITVFTRCICDEDINTISNNASVSTTPGTCPPCPRTADAGSLRGN